MISPTSPIIVTPFAVSGLLIQLLQYLVGITTPLYLLHQVSLRDLSALTHNDYIHHTIEWASRSVPHERPVFPTWVRLREPPPFYESERLCSVLLELKLWQMSDRSGTDTSVDSVPTFTLLWVPLRHKLSADDCRLTLNYTFCWCGFSL